MVTPFKQLINNRLLCVQTLGHRAASLFTFERISATLALDVETKTFRVYVLNFLSPHALPFTVSLSG